MNRKHTSQYWQVSHQQRASLAEAVARIVRRAARPVRLWLVAREERSADEHFEDLVANHEMMCAWLADAQRRRVRAAAKRMAIERGVA